MEKPCAAKREQLTPKRVREPGIRLKTILELNGSPVGVRLLFDEQEHPAGAHPALSVLPGGDEGAPGQLYDAR